MTERKRALRRELGRRVLDVARPVRDGWDRDLTDLLMASPAFRDASFVAGYLALRDEVNVDAALVHAVGEGKQALLPVLAGDTLRFHAWAPTTPLHRDRLGVLEPADRHGGELRGGELPPGPGILLVPGRAFDRTGMRLGRGAGFYDRILPGLEPTVIAVGVAYSVQLLDSVPADERDRAVRALVTEREFLWCNAG